MISANFIENSLTKLKNIYGLDTRALSLMRVFTALVLLFDLFIRAGSLTAHYTDAGAVPFEAVEIVYWQPGYFSLFGYCHEYWSVLLLFIATGIFYFLLLLGYRTRLFTFLSWVMLVSLQNRNTLILQGGDDALRLLLFWGIFLPWGNFYSLDKKTARVNDNAVRYFSAASVGYVLLIFSVYFFSGILKTSPEWDAREGSALYYALNLDQMSWPLGKMMLAHPSLVKLISVSVKWFEMLVPFLLFIPFKNSWFRMLFIFLVVVFHLCIASLLFVGLFYLINIICVIGLLSPKIMDKFDAAFKLNTTTETPVENVSLLSRLRKNYYFKVVLNCFLFFCLSLSMIWNVSTIPSSGLGVSNNFFTFGYALRLNQGWGMFAPTVLKEDGWYVMEGTLADSTKIDLYRNGEAANYAKPDNILGEIKDDRWRKFGENYMLAQNDFMRKYYCTYLFRDWNDKHPEKRVTDLKIIYVKELTPPPGGALLSTREILCECKN